MVTDLKLSGHKLIIYALIYGFSQDGKSTFNGSYDYIAKSINLSRRSTIKNLKFLIENNLVKKVHRKKGNSYKAVKKVHPTSEESSPVASEESSPNIYIDNNNNNIADVKSASKTTLTSNGEKEIKTPPFNLNKEIEILIKDKRRHLQIIGWFFKHRKPKIPNKQVLNSQIKRWVKTASNLAGYDNKDLMKAIRLVKEKNDKASFDWQLSTIEKYLLNLK